MRRLVLLTALLAGLAACAPSGPPPLVPDPKYVIGQGYALGGTWSYPREDFGLDETGVASVQPASRRGRRTANGEVWNPDHLVAAHRTLQLPAIVSVWNLENGREIRVRVNDRGPSLPGRVIGLSQRAALFLDIPPNGFAQVRIRVEGAPSRALARALPNPEGTAVAIATAPRVAVDTESLAPIPGAREATRIREGRAAPASVAIPDHDGELPPDPLPEAIGGNYAMPGRYVVEAGTFFRRDLAQRQAARLFAWGARVEPFGQTRQPQFRVRMGPFTDLGSADRAVAGVLREGLPEVKLLVE
jgi:rare lipoprotein A